MNSAIAINRHTRRIAGFAALLATLFTTVGTLTLAEHYARTGKDGRAYMAANPAARYAVPVVSRHAEYAQAATQS